MKSPLRELQKAIYDRLKNSISCEVYDSIPDQASFPYVTIGEDTAIDWSTKTSVGQEVTHTLHIFSREKGMLEVKQLTDEVIQKLTGSKLIMENFIAIGGPIDFNQVLRDPDGLTRHSVIRFRYLIEEI